MTVGDAQRTRRRIAPFDRWECVHFVSSDQLAALRETGDDGFYVAEIKAESLGSADQLFDALADAFRFPDYFGRNWDALNDCLGDLAWIDPAKVLLLIDGSGGIEFSEPLGHLIEIWLSVAQEWSSEEVPFHLVIVGP